jgi:hypothetical protein
MSFWEAIPGIGSIFSTIRDIVRNFVRDPNDADKLAAEISLAVTGLVKAEVESRYWLAGNWRPIVMLLIAGVIVVKSVLGTAFEAAPDYVLSGILLMGLAGYRMDGRIVEFLGEMFKFGREEEQRREPRQKEDGQ